MSEQHTFKPGDKLKPVEGGGPFFDAGDYDLNATFTVREGIGEYRSTLYVYFKELTGGWIPERFELVKSAPPSIKSDTQLGKVLALTLGQGSWTLSAISAATGASEAAASARLRDLRAAGYEVTCTKPAGEKLRRYTVRTKTIAVDSNAVATVG